MQSALTQKRSFSASTLASTSNARPSRPSLRVSTHVTAIFKSKTKTVVEEAPAPPQKRGLFSFGGKPAAAPSAPATKGKKAAKKTGSKVDKAAMYEKKRGVLNRFVGSFDLSEVRSQSDAELLYDAKYGKLKDGKMSREQYAALRRKIGGTAKDYWKDWIEVKGEYTDKGYVAKSDETSTNVPALGFLVFVVVALLGTTAAVVTQF
jgi:hypothetical protein